MYSTRLVFQSFVDALETADSQVSIGAAAKQLARRMGFRWFAYLGFSQPMEIKVLSSYPKAWSEQYFARGYDRTDPVVAMARREGKAFRWGPQRLLHRSNSIERRILDEAGDFGIRSGVTVPIRGGYGRFAMFTVAGDQEETLPEENGDEGLETMQLLGLYFHAHVYAKLQLQLARTTQVPLTPRERQCLAWSARGKTMRETAEILGIGRRTVLFHLENARAKLNAVTLSQAVAEATRLNLIAH